MKPSTVRLLPLCFAATLLIYNVSCEYKTQNVSPGAVKDESSTTQLISIKTATAPVIDGTIDANWASVPTLKINPTVPDPSNGLFSGYINDRIPVSLRSMYDNENIYFLAEYADDTKSVNVSPWYFNPATKQWLQESTSKTFDQNGVLTRNGFGEDKVAMLWNIDASTPKIYYADLLRQLPYFHSVSRLFGYTIRAAIQRQ